ncbi:hypothetical protein DFJ73DRAFT_869990 [Zopfochytrium polystomum]|nr:hypothetical protein DFJ73DRAFT_869990 [Zopfochytrium polystomum]
MGAAWRVADSLRSSVSGGAASASAVRQDYEMPRGFGSQSQNDGGLRPRRGSLVTGREGTRSSQDNLTRRVSFSEGLNDVEGPRGSRGSSSSRGTANSTSSKTGTSAWDLAESFLATFTGSSSDQRPFDQTLESSETHSRWSKVGGMRGMRRMGCRPCRRRLGDRTRECRRDPIAG